MNYFREEEFNCHCGKKVCFAEPMRDEFLELLNEFREAWGKALRVTSGRRCAPYNAAVGGKPDSQHLRGNAADLAVSGPIEAMRLAELAEKWGFKGIGRGRSFVHLDLGPPNRRWTYNY